MLLQYALRNVKMLLHPRYELANPGKLCLFNKADIYLEAIKDHTQTGGDKYHYDWRGLFLQNLF
jgi:hypothetical protein